MLEQRGHAYRCIISSKWLITNICSYHRDVKLIVNEPQMLFLEINAVIYANLTNDDRSVVDHM